MSLYRLFSVLAVIALITVAALTIHNATTTSAAVESMGAVALPFGPGIAANYGKPDKASWDSVKPPESYNPVQSDSSWDSVKPPESYHPAQPEASWDSVKPPESYNPAQTGPVIDGSYGSWRPPEAYDPGQSTNIEGYFSVLFQAPRPK